MNFAGNRTLLAWATVIAGLFLACCGPVQAAALTVTANTNWSAINTGSGPGGQPSAADTITVRNGATLTVNVTNGVCLNMQLGGITNGSGNGTLTYGAGAGRSVTVSGAVTMGDTGGGTRTGSIDMTNGGTLTLQGFVYVSGTWTPGTGTAVLTASNSLPTNTNLDTFNNLTISAGTTTLSRGTTVGGDLTISTGATWDDSGNNAVTLQGDLTDNGTFISGTGTYTFSGGALQTLTGTSGGTTTFERLALNNGNNLTLAGTHDLEVATLLTLTNGVIITNANTVYVSNGSAIASAGGNDFIQGNLKKSVATGATARTFEVGTGTTYAPVTVTFASVTTAGDLTVSGTAGTHPQIATSGLDNATPALLNRWWTLTNSATSPIAFTTYTAAFTYVAADIDAGATAAAFIATRFSSGAWNPTTLSAVPTTTLLTITDETDFGDFAIGEALSYNINQGSVGRFNAYDPSPATPLNSVQGNIRTKTSGTSFSLRILHLNTTGLALQNLSSAVNIDLMDATNNTGTFANNCGPNWAQIQTQAVTQAAGFNNVNQFTATFTENNAYQNVRVRVRTNPAGQTGCSGDNFAIRPASLTLEAKDATWQTSGTTRLLHNTAASGGNVHAASTSGATTPRPFTLSATAVNNATPTPGTTTNYAGTPTIKTGPTCVLPAGCAAGTLGIGTWLAASGVVTASSHYSEAGTFTLEVEDATFANVDAVDTTLAVRTISQGSPAPREIGRFVPDHFTFSGASTPQFQTFNLPDASCQAPPSGPKRSFTYLGQPFWYLAAALPSAAVNAVEAGGAVTGNYRGALFKLTTAGLLETYSNNATGPALDTSLVGTPTLGSIGNGTGTYSAAAAGTIAYQRSTAATIPASNNPFTANLSLTVTATDNSEVGPSGNPGTGALTSSPSLVFNGGGTGIAFDSGALFRFGIMKLGNALGSQSLDLPMPLQTQYWAGTGFAVNAADNCTAISLANVSFPTYYPGLTSGNMPAGNVSGSGAFTAGAGSLTVKKPTASVTGAVDVQIDLAAESKTWLQLRRTTPPGTYTQNPLGRAAFGLYGSQPGNYIYFRENY